MQQPSDKLGKVSAGTFGPDAIFTFVLFQLAYVSKDPSDASMLHGASFACTAYHSHSTRQLDRPALLIYALGTTVSTPQPDQGGIGQIDELAVWSRALNESEVARAFAIRVDPSDPDLSLLYNFDEGIGNLARNLGRAGAYYDLVLGGPPDVNASGLRPFKYGVENKCGGLDLVKFTAPTWSRSTAKKGPQGAMSEECGSLQSARNMTVL